MQVPVYTKEGKKTSDLSLDKEIFEIEASDDLLHRAVVRYLANRRENIAKTKTRGERRGGGKKPFKQKHTGRARAGTRRSPIWRKGGVIFGPTGLENYSLDMPKKAIKKSIAAALTTKARDKKLVVISKFEIENPKAKEFYGILAKLPVEGNVLIISSDNPALVLSAGNIANVEIRNSNSLNVFEILKADYVIFEKDALAKVKEFYSNAKKTEKIDKDETEKANKKPKIEGKEKKETKK